MGMPCWWLIYSNDVRLLFIIYTQANNSSSMSYGMVLDKLFNALSIG